MVVRRKGTYVSVADIPRGDDGFPIAGLVVRHFRDKRGWTQEQLARKLGTKDLTVRLIETKNQGLDSMARRRALCQLLGIPPIVLGFGTLEQLEQFLSSDSTSAKASPAIPTVLKGNANPTVEAYREVLLEYNRTNIRQSGAPLIDAVETIIPSLYEQVRYTTGTQEKREYLKVLWEFHNLASKLQRDYTRNIDLSIRHRGEMLAIGLELHNPTMLAHVRKGLAHLRLLEGPQLARAEIDAAIAQLKNAPPIVQSDTYALASHIYLVSKVDNGDMKTAQYYFDLSKKITPKKKDAIDERTPMGITAMGCQLTQMRALITNKKADDALDLIEDYERALSPKNTRLHADTFLSIYRAQAYLLLGYPEYAMELLGDAYTICQNVGDRSKIRRIRDIYHELKTGPYKNNRAVLDFEERLLQL